MTRIRTASFDELDPRTAYLLWQLRERVFVVEQECPYLDLDGRDLEPATRHVWVEDDGRPVAYLRVLEDAPDTEDAEDCGDAGDAGQDSRAARLAEGRRIGRVLVDQDHRGRGLAGELMRAALDVVDGRPCRLDAQSYLVGWYQGIGFEPCGEEFLDDGIPHVPMRLAGAWGESGAQSSRSRA